MTYCNESGSHLYNQCFRGNHKLFYVILKGYLTQMSVEQVTRRRTRFNYSMDMLLHASDFIKLIAIEELAKEFGPPKHIDFSIPDFCCEPTNWKPKEIEK